MIELGDEVKDSVSNFKGIAVSRHSYLQGCDRITVQAPVNKKGKLEDSVTFDEEQLERITLQKVPRKAPLINPGGPEKYSDEGR